MGAAPRVALLSLVLPPAMPVASVDALVEGMAALAARARISIVGGNIARSPGPLIVDVTVTGSVHRRRVLTRSGAHPGDELYTTGSLGGAALGLRMLQRDPSSSGPAVDRYRRPEPRNRFGLLLGRNRAARACIDLSDGLADGVRQLGEASGLGAIIEADAVPVEDGATLARRARRRRRLRAPVCGITTNARAPEKRPAPRERSGHHSHRAADGGSRAGREPQWQQ